MVDVDQRNNDPHNAGVVREGSEGSTTGGPVPRRRRSVSVASAQPSVETVVVKAKRAASTLWTLLHAQNCVLADTCVHAGCREAKLLLLHLKTCAAGEAFPCPSSHHGCEQARKLLAHYRRCRNSRVRQAGNLPSRRDSQQQPVCLICSLVARQARSILDCSSGSSSLSVRPTFSSSVAKRPGGNKRIVSSFMLDGDNMVMTPPPPPPPSPNGPKMPPPPPRSIVPTTLVEPLPLSGSSHKRGNPAGLPSCCVQLQPKGVPGRSSSSTPHASNKYQNLERDEDEDSPPQGKDSDETATHYRPRSASLGGTTLMFSSSNAMVSSSCETINEERPTTESHCGSIGFDDTPYKY